MRLLALPAELYPHILLCVAVLTGDASYYSRGQWECQQVFEDFFREIRLPVSGAFPCTAFQICFLRSIAEALNQ